MGVFSDGSYSTPKGKRARKFSWFNFGTQGVMFSFPVICSDGKWKIVQVRLHTASILKSQFLVVNNPICFNMTCCAFPPFYEFPLTDRLCRVSPCPSLRWASSPRLGRSCARRERRRSPSATPNTQTALKQNPGETVSNSLHQQMDRILKSKDRRVCCPL